MRLSTFDGKHYEKVLMFYSRVTIKKKLRWRAGTPVHLIHREEYIQRNEILLVQLGDRQLLIQGKTQFTLSSFHTTY